MKVIKATVRRTIISKIRTLTSRQIEYVLESVEMTLKRIRVLKTTITKIITKKEDTSRSYSQDKKKKSNISG
jgi:hypothetical protein